MAWWNPVDWFRKKKPKKPYCPVSPPQSKPSKPSPFEKILTPQERQKGEKTKRLLGITPSKRGGGGGGGGYTGGRGGGRSFVKGGKGYYELPSGEVVEAKPETAKAIAKGATTKQEVRTLTQQIKEKQKLQGKPATWESVKEIKGYGYSQSIGMSLKQSFQNIGADIKTFFFGRTHDYIGYSRWTSPFQYTGEVKAEQRAPIYTSLPITAPHRRETLPDFRAPRTWEQVELELEARQIAKEGKYKKPIISGLYERTGSIVPKITTWAIETAAISTPLTAVVMGAKKTSEQREIIISSAKEIPRYPSEKVGYEPSLYFGAAGVSGISKVFTIGKQITAGRIAEGMKAKGVSIPGAIYTKGKETYFITRSMKKTPYFELTAKQQHPIFETAEGYRIGAGSGKMTMRVLDWMSGEWKSVTKPFGIAGGKVKPAEVVSITRKGITIKPTWRMKEKWWKGWRGKAHIVSDEKIIRTDFGGMLHPEKPIGLVGKYKKAKLYEKGRTSILIEPKDLTIAKTKRILDLNQLKKGKWLSFRGGKAKSSAKYLQELYKPQLKQEIARGMGSAPLEEARTIVKPISKTKITPIPKGVSIPKVKKKVLPWQKPLTQQKPKTREKLMPSLKVSTAQFLQPKQKLKLISLTKASEKTGIAQRVGLISISIPRARQKIKQTLKSPVPSSAIPSHPIIPLTPPLAPTSPLPFLPLRLAGAGVAGGVRKFKALQIKGYTPSFFAFIFKIYGKKPKIQTGLGIRPIVSKKIFDIKIKSLV